MRRLSHRDRVLLASSLGALVAAALLFGVVLPMREASAKVAADLAGLKVKLAEAEAMYRQAPAARREVARLQADAKELSRPDRDVSPDMIRQIDQLTKDLGLRLMNLRPGQPQRAGECEKYSASFEVESDVGRIARLLWELEQPPRPLWVEGVEVSSELGGSSSLRATVNVAVYTLKPRGEQRRAT